MTPSFRFLLRGATLFAALSAITLASPAADAPETSADKERKLIDLLKSDAAPGEKGVACKQLAIYGTKEAVPVLAPLLANEQLSSWARIALQTIPGPEAEEALRATLGTLKGRLLVGMINSIGIRRDSKAIAELAGKLGDADPDVASAAAVALGKIGGNEAASQLAAKLANAPDAVKPAVAEGLILAAERFLAEGQHAAAIKFYDLTRDAKVSRQKTLEATRGAILARRAEGVPMLRDLLEASDQALFQLGLTVARELAGPEATQLLLAELGTTTPQREPYLLLAIADRGGPEALATATKAMKSAQSATRIAAISVLERLANPSSIPLLLDAAADEEPSVAKVAKAAVSHVQGNEIDASIVAMIRKPDEKLSLAAIDIAGQRRTVAAIPALLEAAASPTKSISAASFKTLADLGTAAEIQPLLGLLIKNPDSTAAERALSSICVRSARPDSGSVTVQKAFYGDLPDGPKADVTKKVRELLNQGTFTIAASNELFGDPAGGHVKKLRIDFTANGAAQTRTVAENETIVLAVSAAPPAVVDPICLAMTSAPEAVKPVLLRLLRVAGGEKALATVRTAAQEAATKDAALRVLCDWQTTDALPDLANLAKTAADEKFKILALRGQLRLIPLLVANPAEKVAAIKETVPAAQRAEEKRLVLATLADLPSPAALSLIASYITQPDVKDDAIPAALAMAGQIVTKHPAAVIEALEPVSTAAGNPHAQKAAELVGQARRALKK